MITEIAQIDVKPGSEKDFEAAIAKAEHDKQVAIEVAKDVVRNAGEAPT